MGSFNTFGVIFHQAERRFLAEIQALNEDQAVQIFWEHFWEQSPLLEGIAGDEITVEEIEDLGPSDDVPYPEVLPEGPAFLALIEMRKKAGPRG